MAFDRKELTIPAGSRVTLTLKNHATSPVMTHNWVLVQKGKATGSVTFDAPPPGICEYLCTTPGRYMPMRGTLTVQ